MGFFVTFLAQDFEISELAISPGFCVMDVVDLNLNSRLAAITCGSREGEFSGS